MKYNLVGIDGNAYSVMGYVAKAMRECDFSRAEIDAYLKDATSGNYNYLLRVSAAMINECNEIADDMSGF